MNKYDCSFEFDKPKEINKYKYLIVHDGDLDVNNAMLLRTKKDLRNYFKQEKDYRQRKITAFRVSLIGVFNFKEPKPYIPRKKEKKK